MKLDGEMAQLIVKRLPLAGLVKSRARNAGDLLRPNTPPRALAPSRLPSSLAQSVTYVFGTLSHLCRGSLTLQVRCGLRAGLPVQYCRG